jgi:Cu/Ag efflux pump CusA
MGFTVIGGMTAASCIAVLLIPACFYVVEKLSGRKHAPAAAAIPPTAESSTTGGGL